MQYVFPNYYKKFKCINKKCRHNCCIGWEIDIDDDALKLYDSASGDMGTRFKESISREGVPHFILSDGERCPFLNKDNLCDLILSLGEESLCQICDDHPRFRNFFVGRTEIGLGLCCEAAGQLILLRETPTHLIELEDDGENESPDPDETDILSLRSELTALAQDRSKNIDARISALMSRSGLEVDINCAHWSAFLLELERLDEIWADRLEELKTAPEANLSSEWDIPFEQFLVYLLYRHIPGALEDGEPSARIAYCALMTALLRRLFALNPTTENLIELARLYSSELEYSDENIEAILQEIAC